MIFITTAMIVSFAYVRLIGIHNNMCLYLGVSGDYKTTMTENVWYILLIVFNLLLLSVIVVACVLIRSVGQ